MFIRTNYLVTMSFGAMDESCYIVYRARLARPVFFYMGFF